LLVYLHRYNQVQPRLGGQPAIIDQQQQRPNPSNIGPAGVNQDYQRLPASFDARQSGGPGGYAPSNDRRTIDYPTPHLSGGPGGIQDPRTMGVGFKPSNDRLPGNQEFSAPPQPPQDSAPPPPERRSSYEGVPAKSVQFYSGGALKPPEGVTVGAAGGGAMKKSVTFNENISTQFSQRSYGSTSSDNSYPQSPEGRGVSYFVGGRGDEDEEDEVELGQPPQSYQYQQQQQQPYANQVPYQGGQQSQLQAPYQGGPQQPQLQTYQQPYQLMQQPSYPQSYRPPQPGRVNEGDAGYRVHPGARYAGGPGGNEASSYASPPQPQRSAGADRYAQEPVYDQGYRSRADDPSTAVRGEQGYGAGQPSYRDRTPEPVSQRFVAGVTTPGVVGAQEVYNDPQSRWAATEQQHRMTPDRMSFRDKMSLFGAESGETGS